MNAATAIPTDHAAILRAAAERIADPAQFCPGPRYAEDAAGKSCEATSRDAVRWDGWGAVVREYGDWFWIAQFPHVVQALHRAVTEQNAPSLAYLSEHMGHAATVRALRRAAEMMEGE